MVLFPFYYIGEECFFRGFLFLGLWRRVRWHSFWITDVLFTLAHIGKPGLEILLCIPASIIFNCLTLFTRSIVPAVIVHTIMGIMLSILVTFQLVSPFELPQLRSVTGLAYYPYANPVALPNKSVAKVPLSSQTSLSSRAIAKDLPIRGELR